MAGWVLKVCDRFNVTPDHARDMDASVVGLLVAEQELRAHG